MPSRAAMWGRLQTEFWQQALPYAGEIELLSDDRMDVTVGEKRNALLEKAQGEYLCFHDDDDWPEPNYIKRLMEAVESGCDCASFKGIITWNGEKPEIFEHSLKYSEWKTTENEVKYERFPNHLNAMKSAIAKQFKFPEKNFSEDFDWSTLVHQSGLLQTEHYIPEVIYNYRYVTTKSN